MFSFSPQLITAICAILAIYFFFQAFLSRDEKDKSNTFNMLAGICNTIIALISSFHLSPPVICPMNNESQIYTDQVEVSIEQPDYIKVYYSLDGSDPKQGNKYEHPIVITESTTVVARNRFLGFWSESAERAYIFEKEKNDTDEQSPSQNESTMPDDNSQQDDQPDNTQEGSAKPEHSDEPVNTEQDNQETDSISAKDTSDQKSLSEGHNPSEAAKLLTYVNKHRKDAEISALNWDTDLERIAQSLSALYSTGLAIQGRDSFYMIGRQCNGAKNAKKAVSDWITGNDYVPSEKANLLNPEYTRMGGVLYYLPDGNEYGYHYFWIICLE